MRLERIETDLLPEELLIITSGSCNTRCNLWLVHKEGSGSYKIRTQIAGNASSFGRRALKASGAELLINSCAVQRLCDLFVSKAPNPCHKMRVAATLINQHIKLRNI